VNTAFDPALLFISDAEWSDEARRDQFLQHISGHLRMVEDFQISKILWCDNLEQFLWAHPQLPPWRAEVHWRNQLVPIIARLFRKNLLLIDTSNCLLGCSITPELSTNYGRPEIDACFRQLMHAVIQQAQQLRFNPGAENITGNSIVTFSCECHGLRVEARMISLPRDWLGEIDFGDFWPSKANEAKILRQAIVVVTKRDLASETSNYRYKFDFHSDFVEDLCREQDSRTEIVRGLAKRLLMTQAQASSDEGLQDEEVKGKDERRMRISRSKRVHYEYSGQASIRFLRYYGEGEHDAGLN